MLSLIVTIFVLAAVYDATASDSTPQQWVDAHNFFRQKESAANMAEMKWSQDLAEFAKTVAGQCTYDHSPLSQRLGLYGFFYVGENLFGAWGYGFDDSAMAVVQYWYSEKENYTFATGECKKNCGHYTQVVWAESTEVGCGAADCPKNGREIICNYGPGGNMNNQKPYVQGTPCSSCPSGYGGCNGNLCSASSWKRDASTTSSTTVKRKVNRKRGSWKKLARAVKSTTRL